MADAAAPVLTLAQVSKRFDQTQALDDVSLELYPGEIHALLGENGAGKSTLIKIMTGVYQPDQGEMRLDGEPIRVRNAVDGQARGIAAIYQEPMVYPDLNVAENIFISHGGRGRLVRWGRSYREAEAILATLGVKLDVRMPARGLTLAAQQTVEIAKAISLKVRILIMDEPTASLSAHEADQLFKLVRTLREHGVAILFISHRMDEVFGLADRISVFRDGKSISSAPRSEVTKDSAIRDMVGRKIDDFFAKREGRIVGDVDAVSAAPVVSAIAPVPGGVGPLTNAILLTHLMRAARNQAEGRVALGSRSMAPTLPVESML